MILAGDIGGTHTRLALCELTQGRPRLTAVEIYQSSQYETLSAIISEFLRDKRHRIDAACFGIAGPVRQGRSELSNLNWTVEAIQLSQQIGVEKVELINDLEANAYGLALLAPDDLRTLQQGEAEAGGHAALIAAGTGLGEAGLYWDGADYRPLPSEGGHVDFAPRNQLEVELVLYLMERFDHVSYERVLSGPGLINIYKFLRDTGRGDEPAWLIEPVNSGNAAAISQAAMEGRCPLCAQALDLFVSIYGAEAGNLALKFLATGGVYVGGGIAPKIIGKLQDGTFLNAFTAKGRLTPLMQMIPVRVILNDRTALLGAARRAAMLIQKPDDELA
ncbi:MAG: glucokinase [Acidobacteriota bacterium]|nr:glucokinase [Acidobacteriota bacterium]